MTRDVIIAGLAATLVFSLSSANVAATETTDSPPASSTAEKSKKITDRKHPDYVRCRTEPVLGSNAKKRRVCLTNKQWAEVSRDGNAMARDMVESGTSRPNQGN
ncbi:hypothetical protein ACFOWX_02135 [Sphingorhabdus arenilitoris]|uniref:Uncharacterized protein n=1 Tax=Sphingorhabdus arenilitoris TaxID=1490041 RepID=A0ABV8RCY1_9SPHN